MLVDFTIGVIDLSLCFLLSGNVNLELMKKNYHHASNMNITLRKAACFAVKLSQISL